MARILLVDDDNDIRQLGKSLLSHAGHETFLAQNALEALEFIDHNAVDLLITDLNMPTHTGFDLVRFLKSDPAHAELTVAILTGRRERADIETALGLGVHDYIVKPLDPELFLKKLADLLDRRPAKDSDEAEFASLKMNIQARASSDIQIVSVSELGLVIRSSHPFTAGARIDLHTDLFSRIGIEHPAMRVFASQQKPGNWESRISFIGADERTLSKIRAWIYAGTARARAA